MFSDVAAVRHGGQTQPTAKTSCAESGPTAICDSDVEVTRPSRLPSLSRVVESRESGHALHQASHRSWSLSLFPNPPSSLATTPGPLANCR